MTYFTAAFTTKIATVAIFAFIFCNPAGAQNTIKPLAIGDTIPGIELDGILNYAGGKINLAALKGKVILLDFGTSGCEPCMELLPELDQLQRQFKNEMAAFVVTWEKKEGFQAFLKNTPVGKNLVLPIVTNDTILNQYFKHKFIPHEVWINKEGVVCAFTEPEYVNAVNINNVLTSGKLGSPMKYELDYNYNQSLLTFNKNVQPFSYPKAVSYSSFSDFMQGIPGRYKVTEDSSEGFKKISIFNTGIIELYFDVLGESWVTFPNKLRLVRVKDSSRLWYNPKDGYNTDWALKNKYCYESIFPLNWSKDKQQKKMANDLNCYLSLNGRMEMRSIKCWVLIPLQQKQKMHNERTEDATNLRHLLERLNKIDTIPFIVDETGFSANDKRAEIQKMPDLKHLDIDALRSYFQQYGLQLKTAKRNVKVFVLTD